MWMQVNENIETGIVSVALYDDNNNILEFEENMTEDVADCFILMLHEHYCFSMGMETKNCIYKNGELLQKFIYSFGHYFNL